MQQLINHSQLMVKQQKEWGEIITGFETKNKYAILDSQGNQLYFAAERKGSWFARQFLKANRPFELAILDNAGHQVMNVSRPFRFFFPEVTVRDENNKSVGHC